MHKILISLSAAVLILAGCTDTPSTNTDRNRGFSFPKIQLAQTYDIQSPYNGTLEKCIKIQDIENACTLEQLPLIGQSGATPNVDSIMNRLMVSHDWMGERFKQILTHPDMPPVMLKLFDPVTAVIISNDIRPAFFWTGTGAIYIDPDYLWLSEAEFATINKEDDYRSNYGNELQFTSTFRYVKAGEKAFPEDDERTLDNIMPQFARLLFHELAHANDYLGAGLNVEYEAIQTVNEFANMLYRENKRLNLRLAQHNTFQLTNESLYGFADVFFGGAQASQDQKTWNAEAVGDEFETEGANDLYAYRSSAEDIAMLFEAVMMKRHFDFERDVVFISQPAAPELAVCDDYIIGWGERGRIADSDVQPRAQWISEALLPNEDFSEFFSELPASRSIPHTGYCESISFEHNNAPSKLARKFKPTHLNDFLKKDFRF